MKRIINGIIRFFTKPGEFKKGYAAGTGAIALMLTQGLLHGDAQIFWQSVETWLAFLGVVMFRNAGEAKS